MINRIIGQIIWNKDNNVHEEIIAQQQNITVKYYTLRIKGLGVDDWL